MTDWRKLLTDEHLWDYRCKAVPVPLVREIVEEVETLRQDLAAARALLGEVREWIPYYRWIPDLRERVDAIIGKKTP